MPKELLEGVNININILKISSCISNMNIRDSYNMITGGTISTDYKKISPKHIAKIMSWYKNLGKYGLDNIVKKCSKCGGDLIFLPSFIIPRFVD